MTAPRKPAPTSARRVVIMMTPPCHSACEFPLSEKDIVAKRGAKDTKELLRRGHSLFGRGDRNLLDTVTPSGTPIRVDILGSSLSTSPCSIGPTQKFTLQIQKGTFQ